MGRRGGALAFLAGAVAVVLVVGIMRTRCMMAHPPSAGISPRSSDSSPASLSLLSADPLAAQAQVAAAHSAAAQGAAAGAAAIAAKHKEALRAVERALAANDRRSQRLAALAASRAHRHQQQQGSQGSQLRAPQQQQQQQQQRQEEAVAAAAQAAAAAAAAGAPVASLAGSNSLLSLVGDLPRVDSCYPHKSSADCGVCVVMPFCTKIEAMTNALDSVLMQTHKNWELMMVLNNVDSAHPCRWTMEETQAYVDKHVPEHQRWRIKILQTRNSLYNVNAYAGLGRNVGMRACNSELVAFLDDDDLFMPDRLEIQTKVLHEQHAVMVCSDAYMLAMSQWYHGRLGSAVFQPINTSRPNVEAMHLGTYDFYNQNAFNQKRIDTLNQRENATLPWFTPMTSGAHNVTKIHSKVFFHFNVAVTSTALLNLTYVRQRGLEFDDNQKVAQDWNFWHRLYREENYVLPLYHVSTPLAIYDWLEHGRPLPADKRPAGYGLTTTTRPPPTTTTLPPAH